MKTIKCLVLDHELESVNRLVSVLLKFEGIEIVSKLVNSRFAVQEILSQKPDLVFLAIEMPYKTGFEVIKEVRENNFYPSFVFVTDFSQYGIEAIKYSIFDYLLKPININDLKKTINRFHSESINHKIIDLRKCRICNDLSEREIEVLLQVIEGTLSHQIAKNLFISKATVDFHRKNILLKTKSANFAELSYKINCIKYVSISGDDLKNKQKP